MLKYKNMPIADMAFVINLPERIDRKENVIKVLDELHFTGYEFFDGVKNTELEWRKYGCTQSFLDIFKIALDSNVSSLVIFEDDIKKMNGASFEDIDVVFSKWEQFSRKYDLIALGTRPVMGSTTKKDDDHFGTTSNSLCAHAFYYKRNFIEYFYENMKNYKTPGDKYYKCIVDEFINDCCSHEQVLKNKNKLFNVGITIPMIFTQRHSFSDNENCDQNLDEWIEFCFWESLKKE